MKYTFAFILFIAISLFSYSNAQDVNWMTLEQAQTASKKDGKPIIMDIHTVWCGPCKMLAKITFKDSTVIAYLNENFHAVKFNGEGNEEVKFNGVLYTNPGYNPEMAQKRNTLHELTIKLKVSAYPTISFINKAGEVFRTELGYLDPTKMMEVLEKIVNKK